MPLSPSILIMASIALLIITAMAQRKHFLMFLLTTEAITLLMVCFLMLESSPSLSNSPYIIMLILTLGATEAGAGLALLVMMSRFMGNDMMTSLSMLKC